MKNKNKVLTQFDLSSAFTALEDLDYAAPDTEEKGFQEKLVENKGYGKCFEPLFEDLYNLEDTDDLNAAADAREEDVAQAKLTRIEKIIDLDAKSPDELLPSYVGKIIVQCPQCMNLFYKDEADIEKSEEDPTLCNVGEECQHCGNTSGYTLIGKVGEADTEDITPDVEDEVNPEATDETVDETQDEPTDEQTEEPADDEDLNVDDLDLNLDDVEESFNTAANTQVLTENKEPLTEECINKIITDFLDSDSSTHKSLETILTDLYEAHPEVPAENVQSAMDGVLNVNWPISKIEKFGFCAKNHAYVESITEDVDKDLDKKLAEHASYINYLRKEIETLENEIKNENNAEIKSAKQAHLDELNQSLEAALPEAIKTNATEDAGVTVEPAEDQVNEDPVNDNTDTETPEDEQTTDESDENAEDVFGMNFDSEQEVKESLTEDKRDDDDFYGRDIDDALIQLKKRGHAEFWCRQGKGKAEEVVKLAKEKYNLNVEYTINDDYCEAKVIEAKNESINEENYNYSKADIEAQIAKLKELIAKEQGDKETAEKELEHANDEFLGKDEQAAQKAQATIKSKTDLINKYTQKITYWENAIKNHQYTEAINWNPDSITKAEQVWDGVSPIDAPLNSGDQTKPEDEKSEDELDEAVAITISVDEVDDTVTPSADTMVIDNGDAGVAKYDGENSDVFSQEFEPVQFNRPKFDPFASTGYNSDYELETTPEEDKALQDVNPEDMEDKNLDKDDKNELDTELASDNSEEDKPKDEKDIDDDDKSGSKKVKDEALTESVKLTENKSDKWIKTLDNFFSNEAEKGNAYIIYARDRDLNGIDSSQNQRYFACKSFGDVLTTIAKYSKADRDNRLVVLKPSVNLAQFKNTLTQLQTEAKKDVKSKATQDILKEFNKLLIASNIITEFVNGKQTKEGKACLVKLYNAINANPYNNGAQAEAEPKDDIASAEAEAKKENSGVLNTGDQAQAASEAPVEQPAQAEEAPAEESAKEEQADDTQVEDEQPAEETTNKLSRAEVEAKLSNFSERERNRVLSVLKRAGLIEESLYKELSKTTITEDVDTVVFANDDEYNDAFDKTTYGKQLSDFYDLGDRCSDLYEDVYRSLGFPMDDEWIIAPEILVHDDKVTELYNAVRERVLEILNGGELDQLDDGHHGDTIETIKELFNIHSIYENFIVNEDKADSKVDKPIVDDVTDEEFKELINSDIFNEKVEDECVGDDCENKTEITEDASLDSMIDNLENQIDDLVTNTDSEDSEQAPEEKTDFDQDMLDELDETGLEECLAKSLTNVYENVDTFKINNINLINNKLVVEGKINFNSGSSLDTKYIFDEAYKQGNNIVFNGYNNTLAEDCDLTLTGNVSDKKFMTESFEYNYTVDGDQVKGKVNKD